jgi:hypothetical protein
MQIMHRSGSHYVLKRTCRRGRFRPCFLLFVDSLALSLVSWRWVARNVCGLKDGRIASWPKSGFIYYGILFKIS